MSMFKGNESARAATLGMAIALLGSSGCGGDDDGDEVGASPTGQIDAGIDGSAAPAPGSDGGTSNTGEPPLYLFTSSVFGADSTQLYALFRTELDFNITADDLKTAHEFPGYTGIAAIGEYVVTGDSESPFATRWKLGDDLKLTPVGEKLNFGKYFMSDEDGLNFYFQSIRGSDMNLFFGSERTSRAHWNTDQWKIVGEHNDTQLPNRPGWELSSTGNRTWIRDWKGSVMQTFNAVETATEKEDTSSYIAVYDEVTQAEKKVITVPNCPGLQQATKDEQGNIYFATTFSMPTAALYNKGPAPCVVRVTPDGTLDSTFPQTDLRDYTNGHYGVNFRYLGNGKALANVVHHERIEGANWAGEPDPKVEERIEGSYDEATETDTPEDATIWELHVIDLASKTSKIVTGFTGTHDPSYYTVAMQAGGRTFFNFQTEDANKINGSAVYELNPVDATVKLAGNAVGELNVVQIR